MFMKDGLFMDDRNVHKLQRRYSKNMYLEVFIEYNHGLKQKFLQDS